MMTPRRLRDNERVQPGDLVANDDGDLSKGFARKLQLFGGELAGRFAYPLYRKRTLLVLGHGGHGKGTFCRLLSELYGAECLSSSEAALPYIFPALNAVVSEMGYWYYISHAHAYDDRRSLREVWKQLISLYNTPDKSTLTREVLSRAEVYDGMRCADEFEASRHLFDVVVWVDASERQRSVDPSMSIEPDASMWYVDNNGTIDDLAVTVRIFAESWGLIPLTS